MRTPVQYVAKDGTITWRVRFRLGRGRSAKQDSETFDDEQSALDFALLIENLGPQAALEQLYADEQTLLIPTLNQVAADHIEHLTGIEDGTRLNYTRLWARTWGKQFGEVRADRLTKDMIRKATNILAEHYSYKSLKNQRGLLAGVCQRIIELGHLPTNPTKGLRLPRGNEIDPVEMCIIPPEEFDYLLERISPHYRPFVMFLYGTGARYGEAVVLTRADFPLPNVRLTKALKWSPDNNRKVGATKTRKSKRTLLLPAPLIETLKPLLEIPPGSLVFTAPKGGAINHRTFWSDIWLPAVKDMNPRPRIHDLRHSHASILLGAGVPIHVVQARLGHESIQTTVDTYSHLLPDAQLQAANAAALAFKAPELERRMKVT